MKNFYVYIVEDVITKEYYIGSRGCIGNPLDDVYLGSPYIWKPNIKNLIKKIIKDGFITMEEAISFERQLIINNIGNNLNRNYSIPYSRFNRSELITARDKSGKVLSISKNDPLFGADFFGVTKGKVFVRDAEGNQFYVDVDDSRYKEGILVNHNKGRMKKGKYHLNFGKKHINKDGKQILVKIDDLDFYINNGWILGTLQKNKTTNSSHCDKTWITKDDINKRVNKQEIDNYINTGWSLGRKLKKYGKRK